MKVSQKRKDKESILLEAVASASEVNRVIQAAHIGFAISNGLKPEPNKSVEQVVRERLGIDNLDSVVQASAIDALVPYALDKHGVVPAFLPKAEPKSAFVRDQPFIFMLNVVPKPEYELSSYEPVEISLQPSPSDEEMVEEQLDEIASRFMTYVSTAAKPVEMGDSCLIALKCFTNGEEITGLTTEGQTYTVGDGYMPEGFDKGILGMEPGETRTFTFEAPDLDDLQNETVEQVECTVTIVEMQKPVKPIITDAWVKTNMPMYRTAALLRKAVTDRVVSDSHDGYDSYCLQVAAQALSKRFNGAISDRICEAAHSNLVNGILSDLGRRHKTWEMFVAENGGEQQTSIMLMIRTRELLAQGFSLDAVYRKERLVINDKDLDAVAHSMNPNADPAQTRQQLLQTGRGFILREAAERMKANRWVLDHAKIII